MENNQAKTWIQTAAEIHVQNEGDSIEEIYGFFNVYTNYQPSPYQHGNIVLTMYKRSDHAGFYGSYRII